MAINDKKFKPTEQWMALAYLKLNRELFGGALGQCILRPFTKGKGSQGGTLGWFKLTKDGVKIERATRRLYLQTSFAKRYVTKDNFFQFCQPCIELNANYSWTEHAMLATLAHEMCHYYTYMNGIVPKQWHGPEFYSIGRRVSEASNGLFTIQRLADAEQMKEMELDQEFKEKKEKRLSNKKSKMTVIFVYTTSGKVRMTTTTSDSLIKDIIRLSKSETRYNVEERGVVNKIVTSNDADLIEFLFNKGHKKSMRTYRYWNVENKPWINDIQKYNLNVVFDRTNGDDNKPKPTTPEPTKYFVLKFTSGKEFKTKVQSLDQLRNELKQQFPKMSDETIQKLLDNPTNYKTMNEQRKNINTIIKEVLEKVIKNQSNDDDSIYIDPNMNLGLQSPLEDF